MTTAAGLVPLGPFAPATHPRAEARLTRSPHLPLPLSRPRSALASVRPSLPAAHPAPAPGAPQSPLPSGAT